MSERSLAAGSPRAHSPSPQDWVEVLTNPTVDLDVGSRFVGAGRNAGYKACETGDLPAFKLGGKWRVLSEPLLQRVGLTDASARENALRRARRELEGHSQAAPETGYASFAA